MVLIPLRTDSPIRRPPKANYALIAANVMVLLLTYDLMPAPRAPGDMSPPPSPLRPEVRQYRLLLDGAEPELHQLFTYQFLHDGLWHLLGNMLFLWVFGNSVNAKMGQVAYVLFYLACGVAAGAGYLLFNQSPLLGASGSVAGVTTAFLVLFPRSRISFFYWFIVIGVFELPSTILIVAKIIVYDNLVEPIFSGGQGVAYSAHIAGYLAGAVIALLLLWLRAVPRDQFDLLALWKRAYQRRAFARAVATDPMADARARYGQMARTDAQRPSETGPGDAQLDQVTELRRRITDAYRGGDLAAAAGGYRALLALDAAQVLPRQQQLDLANYLTREQQHPQAAEAYEKYLSHYPAGERRDEVRLMLGVIYAKYLNDYERAEKHLLGCREDLSDSRQRQQCSEWLDVVTRALGRAGKRCQDDFPGPVNSS